MFAQPKKMWPTLATLAALVFAFQNPEKAAHLITQAFDAIGRFAGALG